MRAPTISQVAKEAGISVATVSRVMNQKGAVSPETTQKVLQAIERLGYQPNIWGRNLRRGESRVALVLVPNVSNPFYAPIISGVEDRLNKDGYSILLCTTNAEASKRAFYLEFLKDGRADGAILMEPATDDFHVVKLAQEYHLVQCCEYCDNPEVSHVSVDNFTAAYQVVIALAELGHSRIGFIGANNDFISTLFRWKGYQEGLRTLGFPLRQSDQAVASGDYSFTSGVEAARKLLGQKDRPTALFCVSDVLALGAIQAARELEISVPEELSVVGFDDVEYATMGYPKLTTVRQPCYELGKAAAELLLHQINGGQRGQTVYLDHQIVVRDSTAPWPLNHTFSVSNDL